MFPLINSVISGTDYVIAATDFIITATDYRISGDRSKN
jgi:hypothetical protein